MVLSFKGTEEAVILYGKHLVVKNIRALMKKKLSLLYSCS